MITFDTHKELSMLFNFLTSLSLQNLVSFVGAGLFLTLGGLGALLASL